MENIIIGNNAEVKIFDTVSELHTNAAGYICACIKHYVNRRKRCTLVLSGGKTPATLYDEIGGTYKDSVEWNKVYFFWGDERCVPPSNNESNYKMAYEHLLSKLQVPKENIFRIQGEEQPEKAADLYEEVIRIFFSDDSLPSFDVTLLGIGQDGHTASLFPGSKALSIINKTVVPAYSEKLKSWRISLTFPVINNSKNLLVIAEGKDKSEIVNRIFNDKNAELPAQKISASNGMLTWLLDREAAGTAFAMRK